MNSVEDAVKLGKAVFAASGTSYLSIMQSSFPEVHVTAIDYWNEKEAVLEGGVTVTGKPHYDGEI